MRGCFSRYAVVGGEYRVRGVVVSGRSGERDRLGESGGVSGGMEVG